MKREELINKITIENLADNIEYLEEVAMWCWEEWDRAKGASLEDVIYRTRHSICKDKIPMTYIAKHDEKLVGTVSIWQNDLISRQDLTPWIAALYIKKEYRGKGIGTLLQEKCIQVVSELGFEKLYLITDHENYYEKCGWKFLELAPLGNGKETRIYEYEVL